MSVTYGRKSGSGVVYSLASTIKPLLGPHNHIIKCMVEESNFMFTCCAAHLLQNLDIQHPVGHLLAVAVQAHHDTYRCGTSTLLVMVGAWLKVAEDLLQQGIPLTAVIHGFHEGLDLCVKHLQTSALTLSSIVSPSQCKEHSLCDENEEFKEHHQILALRCGSEIVKSSGKISNPLFSNDIKEKDNCPGLTDWDSVPEIVFNQTTESNKMLERVREEEKYESGKSEQSVSSARNVRTPPDICTADDIRIARTSELHMRTDAHHSVDDDEDISWFFDDGKVPQPPNINDTTDLLTNSMAAMLEGTPASLPSEEAIFLVNTETYAPKSVNVACNYEDNICAPRKNHDVETEYSSIIGQGNTDSDFDDCFEGVTPVVKSMPKVQVQSKCECEVNHMLSGECEKSDDEFNSCFDDIRFSSHSEGVMQHKLQSVSSAYKSGLYFHGQSTESRDVTSQNLLVNVQNENCGTADHGEISNNKQNTAIKSTHPDEAEDLNILSQKHFDLEMKLADLMARRSKIKSYKVLNRSRHHATIGSVILDLNCQKEMSAKIRILKDSDDTDKMFINMENLNEAVSSSTQDIGKIHEKSEPVSVMEITSLEKEDNFLEVKKRLDTLLLEKTRVTHSKSLNRSRHFRTTVSSLNELNGNFNNFDCTYRQEGARKLLLDGQRQQENECTTCADGAIGQNNRDDLLGHDMLKTGVPSQSPSSQPEVNGGVVPQVEQRKLDGRLLEARLENMVNARRVENIPCASTVGLSMSRHMRTTEDEKESNCMHMGNPIENRILARLQTPKVIERPSCSDNDVVGKPSGVEGATGVSPVQTPCKTLIAENRIFTSVSTLQNTCCINDCCNIEKRSDFELDKLHCLVQQLCHCGDCDDTLIQDLVLQTLKAQKRYSTLHNNDFRLDLDCVHSVSLGELAAHHSCVEEGLVIVASAGTLDVLAQHPEPRNALLINGDVTSKFHHQGFTQHLKTTDVCSKLPGISSLDKWLQTVTQTLQELEISAICVKGSMDANLLDWCHAHNIAVVLQVSARCLLALAESTQVHMASYLTDCTQENVAKNLILHAWSPHWLDQFRVKDEFILATLDTCIVQTVVICHPILPIAKMKEERFWHEAWRLSNALKANRCTAGAGRTEKNMANFLQCTADMLELQQLNSEKQFHATVFRALAEGFEQFVQIVQDNIRHCVGNNELGSQTREHNCDCKMPLGHNTVKDASLDSQITTDFNHPSSDINVDCEKKGQNILCTKLTLLEETDTLDDYTSKVSAWRSALHVLSQVLQTDSQIITGLLKGSAEHSIDSIGRL